MLGSDGMLSVAVDGLYPLDKIAQAHHRVEAGSRGRVLVTIPT